MSFNPKAYSATYSDTRRAMRARLNTLRTITPLLESVIAREDDLATIEARSKTLVESLAKCVDKIMPDLISSPDPSDRARVSRLVAPLLARFGAGAEDRIRLAVLGAFRAAIPEDPAEDFPPFDETQVILGRSAALTTMWDPLARIYDLPRASQAVFFGGWDDLRVMQHLGQVLQEASESAMSLILRDIPITEQEDIFITAQSVQTNLASLYATILERRVTVHFAQAKQKTGTQDKEAHLRAVREAPVPPLLAESRERFLSFTSLIYQGPRNDSPRSVAG